MAKQRVRVKAQLVNLSEQSEPEYHSAAQSRRLVGYGTSGNGPNTTLAGAAETLRNRSRHAFRNSPMIKNGLRAKVKDTIGTGIIPRFRSQDKEFNETMRATFEAFSNECDPEGILSIYGMQAVIDAARRQSGECFIRRRRRSLSAGLAVPLQLQVLEADFVPLTLNDTLANGNKIKYGIELNKQGKRVAYWMYKSHPGEADASIERSQLIRIPARDIIHCYWPERPGQLRGEPDASAALLKVKTYESYDDAELQRKESRSGYTGMLTRQEFDDQDYNFSPFDGSPLYDDVEGAAEPASIRPGTFITGLPGESLTLFDGDNTGSGYKDYTREQKLMIAAAFGVPVELMTGDWSGVNDRIYRAFIQEYRRGIEMDQDHIIIFQVLRKVIDWVISAAILVGRVKPKNYERNKADYHKVDWRTHAWKHIHPVQDIQSQVMAKDNRLNSGDALIADSGYEAEEIDEQIVLAEVRWNELREKHGLAPQNSDKPEKGNKPPTTKQTPDPDEDEEDQDSEEEEQTRK